MRTWMPEARRWIETQPWIRRALRRALQGRSATRTLHGLPLRVTFPAAQHFNLYFCRRVRYEPESLALLVAHLPRGGVCFDVGANLGIYTLVAAHAVGSSGRVHAFEPDPQSYEWLERNVALNGARHVVLHRCAVGERSGTAPFHQDVTTTRTGSLRDGAWAPDGEKRPRIDVPVEPLDAFIDSVERLDFVKIDVEGYELEVLRGARALLARHQPAVLVELASTTRADCTQLLEQLGYVRSARTRADALMQLFVQESR